MMGSKPGGGAISSSEETESGRVVISPKYRGDSSKGGLGHVVGGNIVIDLGCGLIDEGNNGLSKALALKVLNKPNQSDVRLLKRAHFELESDGFSKAQEEENCSSSGFQVSHVSEPQNAYLMGEVSSKSYNQETGKGRNSAIGKKTLSSIKSHGMITRKDRINEENDPGSVRCLESIKSGGNGRWNLEKEVEKVIEKGVVLGVIHEHVANKGNAQVPVDDQNKGGGSWSLSEEVAKVIEVGVALGIDFNSNRKTVEEEIGRKEREDEKRRTFSVSVWEDPTQISYSNILQWLGLDWDDHDGQLSPGSEKSKEDTGGGGKVEGGEMGCNNSAHQNNHLGKDDRQTDYRSKRTVGDMGLGEAELFGIGKEKNINGVFKSNKSKGKEVGRSQVFKEAVMMGSKPGGGVISSSEETESGRVVISPKYRGDSSKGGLGHVVGGNIVIDLGCGLIDEGNNGLSKALALKVLNKPNQSDVRLLKRAHFELESDGFSKAQEEENCSSSGFQVSHVSETQNAYLMGEVSSKSYNQETGKGRNSAIGKKTLSSIKSHGMITRKDRINEENDPGSVRCLESIKSGGKGRWNLEKEVEKVIEKGVVLGIIHEHVANKGSAQVPVDDQNKGGGSWSLSEEVAKVIEVGVALGIDFNSNRKTVEEEIGCKEREDEERYKAQQR
ncbi:hypothetical protein LWI29_012847 [Acer saccharum]|uniref:Uncharacterized protein n=1 Tax=Acer saccharum TaxID=4024 RepID=A0AA39SE20_ACESA|nr:hypothetical protein LWI29_012847 [Acer saccharum]